MNRRQAQVFAVLAGAAAALGHAPFGLWPVALIGFTGLTYLVTQNRRPALIAWLGGVGYFALTLHWIVEPFLVDAQTHGWMAPFALIFMSGGLALFWAAAGALLRWISPGSALFWAVALALAEIVRGHVFTGFPWALPAYIWTDTAVRMSAAYWGPYGLTAITLIIAALPLCAINKVRRIQLTFVSVMCCAMLFGLGALRSSIDPGIETARVAMVHPSIPQNEKWDPDHVGDHIRNQILYTKQSAQIEDVALIVWPEAAIPFVLDTAGPVLDQVAQAADGISVLTGINRRDASDWFNSAIVLDGDGNVAQTYDKVHLVPFGEYIPGRLEFLRAMAARTGFGFTPGASVRTIDTPLGQALVLICYEAIFPGLLREVETRPDVLIQITSDGWFGTFAGPFQHLQQAQFRAAEQGLPLVRVANLGVSAVIDALGEIKVSADLNQAGWTSAQMPKALEATLYSKLGDLPVAILLVAALIALSFTGSRNPVANGAPRA